MRFERFEDIIAWQKAKELSLGIYSCFENSGDFGFRDQIRRSAVSVMNNIAEGFERKSNKEFRQFLFIAKGSCGETRSMLILSKELKKIGTDEFNKLYFEILMSIFCVVVTHNTIIPLIFRKYMV